MKIILVINQCLHNILQQCINLVILANIGNWLKSLHHKNLNISINICKTQLGMHYFCKDDAKHCIF